MAVLLSNGTYQSKVYEEAGLFLSRLDDYIFQTNHHISFTSKAINAKFDQLKNDFDSRVITKETYLHYLRLFKSFFDKYQKDYPTDLNKEILKEVNKYFK